MSGNLALSRLERVYMVDQPSFDAIVAPGNSNCVRHIKVGMKNDVGLLTRRDKTGSRTATIGTKGRSSGTWTYEGSLAPNGTPGVVPDFAPLLKAIFGAAPTIVGATSCTWNFVDSPLLFFSLWSFRNPSTLNQRGAGACTPTEMTITIGQDVAEFTASGECKYVIESDYYASATTEEKMGLGSMPAEPGAPVTNGGIIAGFTGSISIGGTVISRIRSLTSKINQGTAVIKDTFGHFLPNELEGDVRNVTCSFSCYDTDEAEQAAIRNATLTKTPVDIDATVGTVAGSRVRLIHKNVQLASYDYDDSGRRFVINVPESRAYGTSISSKDEVTLIIT